MNCDKPFDGHGGELAHSWTGGDVHFDEDENYKKDDPTGAGINLLKVRLPRGVYGGEKWTQLASKFGSGGRELHPEVGKNSFSFCSQKVKHWMAAVLKQKCTKSYFNFNFFPG